MAPNYKGTWLRDTVYMITYLYQHKMSGDIWSAIILAFISLKNDFLKRFNKSLSGKVKLYFYVTGHVTGY